MSDDLSDLFPHVEPNWKPGGILADLSLSMPVVTTSAEPINYGLDDDEVELLHGPPFGQPPVVFQVALSLQEARFLVASRLRDQRRQETHRKAVEAAERFMDILDGETWVNRQGRLPVRQMTPRHAGNSYRFLERNWAGPVRLWEDLTPIAALHLTKREDDSIQGPDDTVLGRALLVRAKARPTRREKRRDREASAVHAASVARCDVLCREYDGDGEPWD